MEKEVEVKAECDGFLVKELVSKNHRLPERIYVPKPYALALMESQAYVAGYVSRFREEQAEIDRLTRERDAAEEAKYPVENGKIDAMEKALRLCLHVIQKGIEVRMSDSWPALKQPLEEAKADAMAALKL